MTIKFLWKQLHYFASFLSDDFLTSHTSVSASAVCWVSSVLGVVAFSACKLLQRVCR